jgi:uncharacterized protein (DUF697 family)
MSDRHYAEAKKAIDEAEALEISAERTAKMEALRSKAAELLSARQYAEAKQALEEADELEAEAAESRSQVFLRDLRTRLHKLKPQPGDPAANASNGASSNGSSSNGAAPEVVVEPEPVAEVLTGAPEALRIVNLYSKIAAGVGLLPGGLLNFAAIFAVQVAMVWRIAKAFGHTEGKEKVRGSVMSLIGSVLPTGIGHGAGLAIAAIPAVIAGTLVYFLVTPVLAYAMTRAVGNSFIMHFESGGTLLTFDAQAFGAYFLKEFQKAGGTVKTEAPAAETTTASAAN